MLQPILTVAAIRRAEKILGSSLPPGTLMERAGSTVAECALSMAQERTGGILIVAGPGNNGGDALVAARVLHQRGITVRVALLKSPECYAHDAAGAWKGWLNVGGLMAILPSHDEMAFDAALLDATLVIDGLFGIGFRADAHRPLSEKAQRWIGAINAAQVRGVPVLAIDVPSGLDADRGTCASTAIHATKTLSFIAAKPGLYTGDGPDYCGHIDIETLGFAEMIEEPAFSDIGNINAPEIFADLCALPLRNSHKGQFGSLGICGGADGMVGAALLAARMGLHAGAGRVYVQLLARAAPGFDALQPELMLRSTLRGNPLDVMVAGPGMGSDCKLLLDEILQGPTPLVLDADALNAIAATPSLAHTLCARAAQDWPTILTPHPLEAARLLGLEVGTVQADRLLAARQLAERYHCTIVLKGAGTVIAQLAVDADPNRAFRWAINTTGNPALATGGTGDVLAGLIGAVFARSIATHKTKVMQKNRNINMLAWQSALAGVWLHGSAADDLVAAGTGPIGLAASELILAIRLRLNAVCVQQT